MMEKFSVEIISFMSSMFCLYTIYCFLDSFLGRKKGSNHYFILAYLALLLSINIMYLIHEYFFAKMIVNILCIFVITLLYQCNYYKKILATTMIYVLAMINEIGITFLFSIVKEMNITILFNESNLKLLMIVCSQLLYFMVIKIIISSMKKIDDVELPLLYWLLIFSIPSISIFVLYVIFSYNVITNHIGLNFISIIAVFSIMIINCLVFYLYDKLLTEATIKTQNTLLEQQIRFCAKQYEETENMQRELGSIRHDIRNRLIGAISYLKLEDYVGLKTHLDNIVGEIEATKGAEYSGNAAIDSVLYHKLADARKMEVPVKLDLRIPQNLQVDQNAFSIILGNAMDNAIEACKKMARNEQKITVTMNYNQKSLYIEISNPYNEKLNYDSYGELISNKRKREKHGFGVKNIKDIVNRNSYFMTIDDKNHIFKLQVLMFDKETDTCR